MDPCIVKTSEGMAKFQKRKLESNSRIFQLRDIEDLEGYCYYVAGVVGMMLTGIFCKQGNLSTLKSKLEKYQVQFGAALQITNIAKDYEKDLSRGWCYIPTSVTKKYNIRLEKLSSLSVDQKQGVLRELTPTILNAYDSILKYIEIIPENERPVRMFCIIPFVLAYNTLLHITEMKGNKISREQVATILTECSSYARSNRLLEEDYSRVTSKIDPSRIS
jgi:farnesyl-diphosphate farnesyltransferase